MTSFFLDSPFLGPTLLLQLKYGAKTHKIYACSASRSNKCKILAKNQNKINYKNRRIIAIKRVRKFLKLKKSERKFCITCQIILLPCEWEKHLNHNLIENVCKSRFARPTKLLSSKTINNEEAQFLFDETTVLFLISTLSKLGFTRIINLGCPSIHEMIQVNKQKYAMESLLLDIDSRYCQFYTRRKFILFNMFNGHFFEEDGQARFENFIQQSEASKMCLLIDPPFGGLVQAIAKTIETFNEKCSSIFNRNFELPMMFFFPYFNEKIIRKYFNHINMLDYKVNYINHLKFCKFKTKFGSVVRIFTNINSKLIELPYQEGYRFCKDCQKYVSSQNQHCFKCGQCTSKDGRPSIHCNICKKCVKETWKHCSKCGLCCLPQTCKCVKKKSRII